MSLGMSLDTAVEPAISRRIAAELEVGDGQVRAAVRLLDEGATVPFVARYRKEASGGLTDVQLRTLEDRLRYLRQLEERRAVVLNSIAEQGKLTPALGQAIREADTRTRLEDLYLPFRPKRRTRAQAAREAGLEPLAVSLLEDAEQVPEAAAAGYVDGEAGIADVEAALEGARYILMERFAEEADLIGALREEAWEKALLRATVVEGREQDGAKFGDYFDFAEPVQRIPSHRALALFRGEAEEVLRLDLEWDPADGEDTGALGRYEQRIALHFGVAGRGRPADGWLQETVRQAWRRRLRPRLGRDLMRRLWERAEQDAIRVFSCNLRDLLLAAPAGSRPIMGLDPGLRTGVKVAVIDRTGKMVDAATIYPHPPHDQWDRAAEVLAELCRRHAVELVGIGNGTAARETRRLVDELIRCNAQLGLTAVMVNEAGASVYSASALASAELPQVDVSLRGAVSIARRLQDPLAELVKIDPQSIGVGQYQHDVDQSQLAHALDGVVEDCVNAVGVDVNTASAPLLARVSGLNAGLAERIVAYREENGRFRDRQQLRGVPRLGEKTFEQAAGFLRIPDGDNPLDASAVHPEAYPVVERIVEVTGRSVQRLIGDADFLRTLEAREFVDGQFGEPTVRDILAELEKPGRDPRREFKTATFKEGVEALEDLEPGMRLEGVVTNVVRFGAFVDIGVHRDGLVHISEMSEGYVRDPHDVVRAGQVVRVRVLEVDPVRQRIALSLRLSGGCAGGPTAGA